MNLREAIARSIVRGRLNVDKDDGPIYRPYPWEAEHIDRSWPECLVEADAAIDALEKVDPTTDIVGAYFSRASLASMAGIWKRLVQVARDEK